MAPFFYKQSIIAILSSVFFISSSQVTNWGSTFTTTSLYQYQHEIINCNDDSDCTVTCSTGQSCYNTTIFCPDSSNACTITCSGSSACYYADIHWIPGSTNSLTCDSTRCYRTPYPPSTNDNTPLTVSCNSADLCYGTIITCPDNAECQVLCSGDSSCQEAIIDCPSNALCNVVCTGIDACENAVVHWKSSGTATFACPDGGDQCNLINPPSTLNATHNDEGDTFVCSEDKECASTTINCPSNGNCAVHCSGIGSCAGSIINCGGGDCNIFCTEQYACDFATIYGPTDKGFSIYCDDESYACQSVSVYAQDSSYFNLLTSQNNQVRSANNMSIWFPPKKGDTKIAHISANNVNFNGYYGYESQQFYAINGWLDVDIHSEGEWIRQGGTMHCGINYTYSCSFNDSAWSCDSSNPICDDPLTFLSTNTTTTSVPTTKNPSAQPTTKNPTAQPTTVAPTSPTSPTSPTTTETPTTQRPTRSPTKSPTTKPPTTKPPTTKPPTTTTTMTTRSTQSKTQSDTTESSKSTKSLDSDAQVEKQDIDVINNNHFSGWGSATSVLKAISALSWVMVSICAFGCCAVLLGGVCCWTRLKRSDAPRSLQMMNGNLMVQYNNQFNNNTNTSINTSTNNIRVQSTGQEFSSDEKNPFEIIEMMPGNITGKDVRNQNDMVKNGEQLTTVDLEKIIADDFAGNTKIIE